MTVAYKLPTEFTYENGYRIVDSDVRLNKISVKPANAKRGIPISFAVYSKTNDTAKNDVIIPGENKEESNYLSTKIGVDESIRKMLVEIMPKSLKGIVIVNEHQGILMIITKPFGGVTGQSGVIRTVEYLYKLSSNANESSKRVLIFPMVFEEDIQLYPKDVYEVVRDFTLLFMKEIQIINNKRFNQLFDTYEETRNKLETIGSYIEKINQEFYEQLMDSNVDGVVFNEFPLLKLQTMLQSCNNILTNQTLVKHKDS